MKSEKFVSAVQRLLLMLMLMPAMARAQFSFDFTSVEALIDDHKRVRSVLMARSGVEQANELLHQYSREANVEYDSLNVKLDKYTKCFDLIDVIYNGGVTVINVKNTYDDVSDRISLLKDLLQDFTTKLTLRGNIVSSDTLIIGACDRAVSQVLDDGNELKKSLLELAQYATGKREMTTAGLLGVIGSINEHLDKIRHCIDHTYYVIYKYVTIRLNYFKRTLYMSRTISEMANDAFARWKRVAEEVGY